MNPTDLYRDKIGDRLTRRLAQAYKDEEISRDELSEISTYILENIDKATDNSGILQFLENISAQWPFLSDMVAGEKEEISSQDQNEKVSQIDTLISENKIDEALKVAKDANQVSSTNDNNQSQGGTI